MKRKVLGIAAFLVSMAMMSILPVSAEKWTDWNAGYRDDPIEIQTDMFAYTTGYYGMVLRSDIADANYMVSGLLRNAEERLSAIVLTQILNDTDARTGGRLILWTADAGLTEEQLQAIQIGDLLHIQGDVLDTIPQRFDGVEKLTVIGHGTDCLGKEFERVIRHEMIYMPHYSPECWSRYSDLHFDVQYGDVTEDDMINLLDVVAVNRSIVGVNALTSYAALAADVDSNNIVDATDSLLMLQYTVHLVDSLGA